MKIEDDLNSDTIEMYMMRKYQNMQCISVDEYHDDVRRIKYIKRLLNRYNNTGELKERLILNHIVVIYNVFGHEDATRIMFFHIDRELWPILKTFFVYLQVMPHVVKGIEGKDILDSDIAINFDVAGKLRDI